ncbi:MAG: MaoC family dehydratase, partial [Myxococcota bacterium]
NPIHTDPEAARQAGLVLPIVGGSHVFAYLQEALMRALGKEALLHGACFDLRWVAQVRAGTCVEPRATVSGASDDRVELDLEVGCEGRVAMTGSLAIPLPVT